MKTKTLLLMALLGYTGSDGGAAIIVNGTGGGGTYATLQEGIDAALASPIETQVTINTNTLAAGASIPEGTVLARPLTIEAGTGFTPVINGTLTIMPNNENTTVTLNNLKIAPTTGDTDALIVGGALAANNCIFDGGPNVSAAVLAANSSVGTTGRLTMTSCTLTGWYCLVVGRAIQDYNLTDSWLYSHEAVGWHYSVIHFGNQPIHRGSGIGLGPAISDDGIHAPATTPRNLNLDRCKLEAGKPIGWPPGVGGFGAVYEKFGNTIGSINAKNTIFQGTVVDSIILLGWFDMITHTQSHKFDHCTFRGLSIVPDVGAPPSQPSGSTVNLAINNTLFDVPAAEAAAIGVYYYAIGGYHVGTVNFSGNGNAYNTPQFSQNGAWAGNTHTRLLEVDAAPYDQIPNFEATYYTRTAATTTDFATDTAYHLNSNGEALAANKAVPLIPPVLLDFEKQIRPGGLLNDIGADEAGATSNVADWVLF